jgi:hypothetical protein
VSGHRPWSEIRREKGAPEYGSPQHRADVDAFRRQLAEEEIRLLTPSIVRMARQLVRELFRR